MATASGNENLVDVDTIDVGITSGITTDHFSLPSDRYAEITIIQGTGMNNFQVRDAGNVPRGSLDGFDNPEASGKSFILGPGRKITSTGSGSVFFAVARIFSTP